MGHTVFKNLLLIALGVLAVSLIIILAVTSICLSGCTGDTNITYPVFDPPQPPIEVTVDQLYDEYMADEAAADAKYEGKRLLFTEVDVEEVVGSIYVDQHGASTFLNEYFVSGHVKFIEIRDFFVVMQNIKVGYVLNIVGDCQGLTQGFVYIRDCWVESVIGDLGKGGPGVEFY